MAVEVSPGDAARLGPVVALDRGPVLLLSSSGRYALTALIRGGRSPSTGSSPRGSSRTGRASRWPRCRSRGRVTSPRSWSRATGPSCCGGLAAGPTRRCIGTIRPSRSPSGPAGSGASAGPPPTATATSSAIWCSSRPTAGVRGAGWPPQSTAFATTSTWRLSPPPPGGASGSSPPMDCAGRSTPPAGPCAFPTTPPRAGIATPDGLALQAGAAIALAGGATDVDEPRRCPAGGLAGARTATEPGPGDTGDDDGALDRDPSHHPHRARRQAGEGCGARDHSGGARPSPDRTRPRVQRARRRNSRSIRCVYRKRWSEQARGRSVSPAAPPSPRPRPGVGAPPSCCGPPGACRTAHCACGSVRR